MTGCAGRSASGRGEIEMIYITGDTHGPAPIGLYSVDGFGSRLNKDFFPEQKEMTRDDFVIICGDFGGIWNYDSRYDLTKSSFREKISRAVIMPFPLISGTASRFPSCNAASRMPAVSSSRSVPT